MREILYFKIENLLKFEKREIKVSHHSAAKEVTLGYEVSTSNNFGLLPAGGDHLLVEIVGAGALNRNCWVKLPKKGNVMFIPEENQYIECINTNEDIFMKIPPGPPTWKLKITRPSGLSVPGKPIEDNVTISDDEP
jgi:hypothetical protein